MSPDFGTSEEPSRTVETKRKAPPPKASPRTECVKCGQFYSNSTGTGMIGRCADSAYDDKKAPGWRDPAHAWAPADEGPNVNRAIEIIARHGGTRGAHHKQWVLDQVLRVLLGDSAYREWVADQARDGYTWDEGIAP